jgi:hypothetical protein
MMEDIKRKTKKTKVRKIYLERNGTKNERTKWQEKRCRSKRNEKRYKGMIKEKGKIRKEEGWCRRRKGSKENHTYEGGKKGRKNETEPRQLSTGKLMGLSEPNP